MRSTEARSREKGGLLKIERRGGSACLDLKRVANRKVVGKKISCGRSKSVAGREAMKGESRVSHRQGGRSSLNFSDIGGSDQKGHGKRLHYYNRRDGGDDKSILLGRGWGRKERRANYINSLA